MKLFLNWLALKDETEETYNSDMFKEFAEKIGYNNRLVLLMAENAEIKPLFQKFLSTDAEKFIEHSKITDKEGHIEGLKTYRRIFNKSDIFYL